MKDINELMARIDGFEPLPVSEETLGAYLEGTLPDAVADSTADIIDAYPELQTITEDAISVDIPLVDTADIVLTNYDNYLSGNGLDDNSSINHIEDSANDFGTDTLSAENYFSDNDTVSDYYYTAEDASNNEGIFYPDLGTYIPIDDDMFDIPILPF